MPIRGSGPRCPEGRNVTLRGVPSMDQAPGLAHKEKGPGLPPKEKSPGCPEALVPARLLAGGYPVHSVFVILKMSNPRVMSFEKM